MFTEKIDLLLIGKQSKVYPVRFEMCPCTVLFVWNSPPYLTYFNSKSYCYGKLWDIREFSSVSQLIL